MKKHEASYVIYQHMDCLLGFTLADLDPRQAHWHEMLQQLTAFKDQQSLQGWEFIGQQAIRGHLPIAIVGTEYSEKIPLLWVISFRRPRVAGKEALNATPGPLGGASPPEIANLLPRP